MMTLGVVAVILSGWDLYQNVQAEQWWFAGGFLILIAWMVVLILQLAKERDDASDAELRGKR